MTIISRRKTWIRILKITFVLKNYFSITNILSFRIFLKREQILSMIECSIVCQLPVITFTSTKWRLEDRRFQTYTNAHYFQIYWKRWLIFHTIIKDFIILFIHIFLDERLGFTKLFHIESKISLRRRYVVISLLLLIFRNMLLLFLWSIVSKIWLYLSFSKDPL